MLWTNIPFNSTFSLNSIYIHNSNNAIVVGDGGKILVTVDNGMTWNSITSYLNKTEIISTVRNLLNVVMVDDNTFILCSKPILLDTTIFISCYFPDLFNHINNTIMDINTNYLVRLRDFQLEPLSASF